MSGQFNLGKVALADGLQQSVISYVGVFINRRHHISTTWHTGTPSSFGIRVGLIERWDIRIRKFFLDGHTQMTLKFNCILSPLAFTHTLTHADRSIRLIHKRKIWLHSHNCRILLSHTKVKLQCSCGSVVEHCVSGLKVVGSIPREHTYWQ